MFDADLLIAFAFMALLFLRQILILREPNKINYAPLMLGIGAISATLHFITHPEVTDTLLILKESLFPILVSLILYIVMNIMHQTQQSEHSKIQYEFTLALIEQLTQLKEFSAELEKKMILNQNEDRRAQEEIRERFKHDIKILDAILANQNKFLENFEQVQRWHDYVKKSFENFIEVQLPSLDSVVHKHIDILRVAEQDHFNKVKATLAKALEGRGDINKEMEELKESLQAISNISQTISKSITKHTLEHLLEVTRPFEKEVMSLKSHTEGLGTTLYESENRLGGIREQSEMIMKQMILSSKKMSELEAKNSSLHDIYSTMRDLVKDIEAIKSEYVKSQSQLSMIVKEFRDVKESEIESIKNQMSLLSSSLIEKVDDSFEKLYKHYNMANEEISPSVKFLSKQAQLKNRYADLESQDDKHRIDKKP
ncbi:MAG: methyl-accepting chemotaxis protein [Campylobacterota bacterium]|nr:methyl-accepting chemotaxis protein [Campylobacterota bacterium]